MSKILFVLALSLLVSVNMIMASEKGPETAEQPPTTNARLEISEYHWEFGDVPAGVKVQHNFVLKNTGTDPLEIPKVRSSCGCSTAPLLKNRLEPGETTDLVLTFNTGNYRGKVQKTLTVHSSDPDNEQVKLTFAATVSNPDLKVEPEPQKVNFVQLYFGEKSKKKVALINKTEAPLKLTLVESPVDDFLKLKMKEEMLKPGESLEAEVELSKEAPLGAFKSSFTVEASGGEIQRVTIPIEGEIVSRPPKG